jgi:hypothetical protein
MKQRNWVIELEEAAKKDVWVIFDQDGRCFGLVMKITHEYYTVRCKCDILEARDATNKVQYKNIKGHYNSIKEAKDAYQDYYK